VGILVRRPRPGPCRPIPALPAGRGHEVIAATASSATGASSGNGASETRSATLRTTANGVPRIALPFISGSNSGAAVRPTGLAVKGRRQHRQHPESAKAGCPRQVPANTGPRIAPSCEVLLLTECAGLAQPRRLGAAAALWISCRTAVVQRSGQRIVAAKLVRKADLGRTPSGQ
jgi:hypothetical protein